MIFTEVSSKLNHFFKHSRKSVWEFLYLWAQEETFLSVWQLSASGDVTKGADEPQVLGNNSLSDSFTWCLTGNLIIAHADFDQGINTRLLIVTRLRNTNFNETYKCADAQHFRILCKALCDCLFLDIMIIWILLTPTEIKSSQIHIYCVVTLTRTNLCFLLVWCCISERFCPCICLAQNSFVDLKQRLQQTHHNLALHILLGGCGP